MAKSKVDNNPKVMDVARPGKGKIVATSRPIVAPIASDNVVSADNNSATMPNTEKAAPLAPSTTHRVIQPLTEAEKTPEEMTVEVKTTPKAEPEAAAATEAPFEEKMPEEVSAMTAQEDKPAEKEIGTEAVVTETEATEPAAEETAAAEAPVEDAPPAETAAEAEPEVTDTPTNPDDSAGVNALADSVKSKKEAAQKAEEQAKRDAELQGLIESKKYVVPIGIEGGGKSPKHHSSMWLIPILLIIVVAAAGYLVVDAGIVKTSITLPVDLIK